MKRAESGAPKMIDWDIKNLILHLQSFIRANENFMMCLHCKAVNLCHKFSLHMETFAVKRRFSPRRAFVIVVPSGQKKSFHEPLLITRREIVIYVVHASIIPLFVLFFASLSVQWETRVVTSGAGEENNKVQLRQINVCLYESFAKFFHKCKHRATS